MASTELAAHVPVLVPKLYRMQFDPNPKVQEAMQAIWQALVDNPREALDANFDAVMKELLKEIGNRLWRNRESACLAIADLMQVGSRAPTDATPLRVDRRRAVYIPASSPTDWVDSLTRCPITPLLQLLNFRHRR
jgi:hypothetical protein